MSRVADLVANNSHVSSKPIGFADAIASRCIAKDATESARYENFNNFRFVVRYGIKLLQLSLGAIENCTFEER